MSDRTGTPGLGLLGVCSRTGGKEILWCGGRVGFLSLWHGDACSSSSQEPVAGLLQVISKPVVCLNLSFHPSWFPYPKTGLPLEVSRDSGLALDKPSAVFPLLLIKTRRVCSVRGTVCPELESSTSPILENSLSSYEFARKEKKKGTKQSVTSFYLFS